MDFPITVDKGACVNLPGLDAKNCVVTLGDTALTIHFGDRFDADIERSAVASAEPMVDPRPHTFLPMGVSLAVSTLGPDTVTVLGAHEGLVEIVFREPVRAHVPPPDVTPNSEANLTDGTISMRRLVINVEDPDGFLRSFNGQGDIASQTEAAASGGPAADETAAHPWPTGG